ncbi:3-phosphoshikimate 1-carboxyvinyltransferase [Candidatus Bathyarchaeota archaeon]|nr:3-phosphoshikimate 1-carboxyvinyltransferase [Candidatus Bathyarchaeota archaeon]
MTDLILKQTKRLVGVVKAPPSKSLTHRALIAATISEGSSRIVNPLFCDDTIATLEACRMLGAVISRKEQYSLKIIGHSKPLTPTDVINCRDSASTMRFIAPVCSLADGISVLTGGESLRRRPMDPLLSALMQLGVLCYSTKSDGRPPLVIFGGGIAGGEAFIPGDVSSQFISGLLFASPLGKTDVDIILSSPLESKPYVEMTMEILRKHKIKFEVQSDFSKFHVPGKQSYSPFNHVVEGDFSSSAFLLAAAAITDSNVKILGLQSNSVQGDRIIIELFRKMGVEIKEGKDFVEVQSAMDGLRPIDVDLRDNPDLVPVLAVVSCFASGKSVIRGVKRLTFKESNREAAIFEELTKMGAKINASREIIEIEGVRTLRGGELDSHGDHRIAMMCIVAALRAAGRTTIRGVDCINKSYPNFVKDIAILGAEVNERELNR